MKIKTIGDSSAFRADIQGLRGIAVIAVVLYHFEVSWLMGAFIGVDIFYVISGFLIYGVIERDLLAGKFSLISFYARRVKRLYPAFLAMLALTMLLARIVFLPSDYVDLFRTIRASLLQYANHYFYRHTDYFDGAAITKPLLHFWSIAVEWQFYLVFPIIFLLLMHWGIKTLRRGVLILAALSFAASFVVFFEPKMAFYLLPFRAWELLLGASLNFLIPAPEVDSGQTATGPAPVRTGWSRWDWGYLLGLALLFPPMVCYGYWEPIFPGPAALPSCLAAALLIACHRNSGLTVKKFLCWRPLVYIGEISYSLYLTHWPFLAFCRFVLQAFPVRNDLFWESLALVLSILAALGLYYWVENPGRRLTWRPGRLLAGAIAASLAVGMVNLLLDRYWGDVPPHDAPRGLAVSMEAPNLYGEQREVPVQFLGKPLRDGERADMLVMGDSHAGMWDATLHRLGEENAAGIIMVPGDAFMLDYNRDPFRRHRVSAIQNAIRELIRRHAVRKVVLAYRWAVYTGESEHPKNKMSHEFMRLYPIDPAKKPGTHRENVETAIKLALAEFKELGVEEVYFAMPLPEFVFFPYRGVMLSKRFFTNIDFQAYRQSAAEYQARHWLALEVLGRYAAPDRRIDVPGGLWRLGGGTGYPVMVNGKCIYSDDDHLSFEGTELLRDLFKEILLRKVGN